MNVHSGTAFSYHHQREDSAMSIIMTLIVGLVVGAVAKLLMPGRDPGGIFITIALGVVGAFVATYLGQALGLYRPGEPAGFIGAVIGALILLGIYRLVIGRRATG
jgi:uncharacterized membrane protein YeaQ/YmgE (transglycosylase-associated protein family)